MEALQSNGACKFSFFTLTQEIGFPLSFDWHLYRYKGGDGDGRKESSQCFNLGLGDNHCYSSSIGRRVHNILEAIRRDAENEPWQ